MTNLVRRTLVAGAALSAVSALAIPQGLASHGADYRATLAPVPHDVAADAGSNVTGDVRLSRVAGRLTVDVQATGLTPNLPHAMHIHGVLKARNECPTAEADINSEVTSTEPGTPDGLISLGEGGPAYGPVQVSFTTSGDTSASSALDLERFATADSAGNLSYNRTFEIPKKIAAKLGKLHIVIHGEDLDKDGAYSNLMEASLPVSCGEINH